MQPHQTRVIDEKNDLDDKLFKLGIFIGGTLFPTLDAAEQDRLRKQSVVMKEYSTLLGERIAAFTPK